MLTENVNFGRYGKAFQEGLVQLVFEDRSFADQITEVLDVQFLELEYLRVFTTKVIDYRDKYNTHPSVEAMITILRTELDSEDEVIQNQVREYFARTHTHELTDVQYIKDVSLEFCRKQNLKEAMMQSVGLLQNCSFDEISETINNALKLGSDNNFGYDYLKDFEARFVPKHRQPVTTGWSEIDGICGGGLGKSELGVVIASTGCHAKGTKIMQYEGSLVNVESIKVGDMLMGPDSTSREVLKLCRGSEVMYRIVPTKGAPFVVNESHILSLKRTNDGTSLTGTIVNISVRDYLRKSKKFKHVHKLYRAPVLEFEHIQPVYEPYFLGIMIGDGSVYPNVRFSSNDKILSEEIRRICSQHDMSVKEYKKTNSEAVDYAMTYRRGVANPLMALFTNLGIDIQNFKSGQKYIPQQYKTATFDDRLEILAGLMDTDGSLSNSGFDYISKSQQLSEDVAFVARSVGLAAYVKECEKSCQNNFTGTYYRVSISGNCDIIPCRLKRKKAATRKQKKDVLVTGFSTEKLDEGDYYGFELSGDHLYLMGDFTVTHNTGKSMVLVHLGTQALKEGKTVVHYTLELQDTVIAGRYDSCLTGLPLTDIITFKEEVFEAVTDIDGSLIIKEYPTKSATTNTIRSHLSRLVKRGICPGLVIVDYADLLKPVVARKEKRNELESIYEDLRALSTEFKCPIWTASQTNRSGLNAEVITMEQISEAFNKCFVADFIFSISRTIGDKQNNRGKMFIAKNRNGLDGMIYPIFMDTSNVNIKILPPTQMPTATSGTTTPVALGVKAQQQLLRDKYTKLKRN